MKSVVRWAVLVLSVAGVLGGVIIPSHPVWGVVLLIGGLAGAFYSYLSSERHQDNSDLMMDVTAELLVASGNGNPYTKLVQRKLSRPGVHYVLPQLERALELDPNDADALAAYAMIGVLHLSLRHISDARLRSGRYPDPTRIERTIERGLATGRYLAQFYAARGVLLDIAKQGHSARQCFRRSAELSPHPYWKLFTSTSYGIEGRYEEALAEMESAISEGAKGPLVDYYYGRCLASLGEFAGAISLFRKVAPHRRGLYQLAVSMQEAYYFSWRPLLSAFYEMKASLLVARISPRKAVSHLGTAVVHCFLPLFVPSAQLLARCTKRVPVLRSSRLSRLCDLDEPYFSLGNSLVKSGKFAAAKKLFALASKKAPQLRNLINLCSSAIATEDWDLAESARSRIEEISPGHPVAAHYHDQIRKKEVMKGRVIHAQFDEM